MKIIDYKEGMQITENCIVRGMPNEIYHGLVNSVSSTYLKELLNGTIYTANRKVQSFTKKKHFQIGGIFHDLVEGFTAGYNVMDRYFVYPEYKKSSKQSCIDVIKLMMSRLEGSTIDDLAEIEITLKGQKLDVIKVTAEMLLEKHAEGKTKVTDVDLGQAEAMLGALKDHPDSSMWMNCEGESELSFFHDEPVEVNGMIAYILLKVRCDRFIETEDSIIILDWKSTAYTPTPKQVVKEQFKYRYDFSAAMYCYVIGKFTDKPVYFLNVFVCSDDPCKENVSVVKFTEQDIIAGHEDFKLSLEKYVNWKISEDGWQGVDRDEENNFIEAPMRPPIDI